MAVEEILRLFDVYWFEQAFFMRKPLSPGQEKANLVVEIHEEAPEAKVLSLPSLHLWSLSDQDLSSKTSFSSGSLSPNSVLTTPKLQTILSGKEVKKFSEQEEKEEAKKPRGSERKARRERKRTSKSLSELEFEEVKGFMDLGFVFSEEDKDSTLVSIIPGLQRLGRNNKEEGEEEEERRVPSSAVSRPYLSEAWQVFDKKKARNPLKNWRIPTLGDQVDMKDHLRFWAHTVASTVR